MVIIVLFIVIGTMVYSLRKSEQAYVALNKRTLALEERIERILADRDAARARTDIEAVFGKTPTILFPRDGATVPHEKTALTGTALGADEVVLYIDGERIAAADVAPAGDFRFADVPLARGDHVLQVVAYSFEGERYSKALFVTVSHPRPRPIPPAMDIGRGDPGRNIVSLTFDGGASDNQAEHVLSVLKREGITTTFFLTGQFMEKYPDVVRRILADGHEIGNHTYNHPHLATWTGHGHVRPKRVTRAYVHRQLRMTETIYEGVTGRPLAPYWRAPYGGITPEILRWAEELGYTHINWTRGAVYGETLDTLDWVTDRSSHLFHTADETVERIVNFDGGGPGNLNGGIILMHLGTERAVDPVQERLPEIIESLRERGYEFGTVTALLERGP